MKLTSSYCTYNYLKHLQYYLANFLIYWQFKTIIYMTIYCNNINNTKINNLKFS